MYVFCKNVVNTQNYKVALVYVLIEVLGFIRQQRPPSTSLFQVCLYKVSDKAVDCWPNLRAYHWNAIYQVQVAHEARPSLVFNLRNTFSDFLKDMSNQNNAYPGNLDVLRDKCCIKLVVSDKVDSENIGFVQYMP